MNNCVGQSSNMELAVKIGILTAKCYQNMSEIVELMDECEKESYPRRALLQAGQAAMIVFTKLQLAGDFIAAGNCSMEGGTDEKS